MVYTWRTFDSMTTFWMLLALYWLLRVMDSDPQSRRWNLQSAVALGVGVMTKYLPILLLPTAWAFLPTRKALRFTLVLILIALLIFGPFLVVSPEFGFASLKAQAAKSSWQTVWALVDGNYGTGNVGPDVEHFDPSLATKLQGNPERIPGWLTLIPFAAVGLYVFYRARRAASSEGAVDLPAAFPRLQAVKFLTLTFALFLLWSKGWSPQWQMMLFPLVLLAFPGRNGTLFCILLGLVSFLEWPILLSRGMTQWLWVTVFTRTALLLGLAVAAAQPLLEGWQRADTMDAGT
jgi:uncharacterized membrane protein